MADPHTTEHPRSRGGRRGPGSRWRSGSEERPSPELRAEVKAWFTGRLPDDWFVAGPEITVDAEEILIVGEVVAPDLEAGSSTEAVATAEGARIERFREETRAHRMQVADEAQARFGRIVSWGATAGASTSLFTTANVPVMTRLRIPQRQVLDTLIDAGIARSRSEALAWCVELVRRNEEQWISELRDAFAHVEQVRAQGPSAGRDDA